MVTQIKHSQTRIILVPIIAPGSEPNLIDSTNILVVEAKTAITTIKCLILIGMIIVLTKTGVGKVTARG